MLRRAMTHYALLPYYRNYWKEAGYREEMEGVERAVAEGSEADIPRYLTDRLLADVTLSGTAAQVRDGRRSVARGRHSHPGAGAALGRWGSVHGLARDLRGVRVTPFNYII